MPKHIEIIDLEKSKLLGSNPNNTNVFRVEIIPAAGKFASIEEEITDYFCRGFHSAHLTARELKKDLFPKLPIYLREGEQVTKLK